MAEEIELKDGDFIATARKRFEQAEEEEKELREEAKKDLRMVAGDQWDEQLKADRLKNGRPALTFNRCHTFVQQVSNEARQNKPQIKFVPAEDGDKDLAEVYEGLARHIQYDSDAQVAYETAVEYSAACGFGYYRFLTEYCDDKSFDQDLKVVPVLDPFSVYGILIPACLGQEPQFAFVTSHLTKEEYKQQYPDSQLASLDWADAGRIAGSWCEDRVRIAEYWTVETSQRKVKSGGNERTVVDRKVKWYKINGIEKLEETEWVGSCIPIPAVLGKQLMVDGRPRLLSVVRFQRDPQQLINFYKTRIAETIGTAPIQPYMVAKGAIPADSRSQWAQLNTRMAPYLEYEPIDVNGKPIPPPQRQVFEPPIASLSEAAGQEIDDMKATAGIFDASLGNKGNESSGIAIQRRQQQSNVTNMHFMDNLERAFKKGGKIIAECLKIYDTPRRIRILGEDEAPKIVKINQDIQEGDQVKNYKFGEGAPEFDVIVTMGRAFSTKRMESVDMMTNIIQGNPDSFPLMADVFFKNSDLAGADQLAERFHAMLPPQILQAEDQKNQAQIPPQIQAALQQLQAQNQQLQAELQQAQNPLKVKEMDLQAQEMKLQHEKELASAKFEHELEMKRMEIELNSKLALAKHDSDEERDIHKEQSKMALTIYQTEAQLAAKQIDRDAAAQQQEAKEAVSTAKEME